MSSPRGRFVDGTLDLCAGLWDTLGVPMGVNGFDPDWAVDPEALIVFTAAWSDWDFRLREEAAYWCTQYGSLLSFARLRNLASEEPDPVRKAYGAFAATVQDASGVSWPGATESWGWKPMGSAAMEDLTPPRRVVLRLRSAFGVGARSEILRCFLARPDRSSPASDLARESGFSKRMAREALESLRRAGVVESRETANRLDYRLVDPDRLLAFVGPLPGRFPPWAPIFRLLTRLGEALERWETLPPAEAEEDATRLQTELQSLIAAANLRPPRLPDDPGQSVDPLCTWSVDLASTLAQGDLPA